MKKLSMMMCILLFVTIIPSQTLGANKLISISPTDELFELANMKPGDWAVRELSIENKAGEAINYHVSVHFESGSKKLFNALQMKIGRNGERLKGGSLGEFQMERFSLPESSKDLLTMKIDFPYELGNEFQGLSSQFKIVITAAQGQGAVMTDSISVDGGLTSTGPTNTGQQLPDTATQIFNFLLTGMILCGAGVIILWWHKRRERLGME